MTNLWDLDENEFAEALEKYQQDYGKRPLPELVNKLLTYKEGWLEEIKRVLAQASDRYKRLIPFDDNEQQVIDTEFSDIWVKASMVPMEVRKMLEFSNSYVEHRERVDRKLLPVFIKAFQRFEAKVLQIDPCEILDRFEPVIIDLADHIAEKTAGNEKIFPTEQLLLDKLTTLTKKARLNLNAVAKITIDVMPYGQGQSLPVIRSSQMDLKDKKLNEILRNEKGNPHFLTNMLSSFELIDEKTKARLIKPGNKRKAGDLFAIIDAIRINSSKVLYRDFTEAEMLSIFNEYLGTDYQKIGRSEPKDPRKAYDLALPLAKEYIRKHYKG